MQHENDLARDALDTICANMPLDQQAARAPVEARRHLLGRIEELPADRQEQAFDALEVLIEERFGPQNVPSPDTHESAPAALEKHLDVTALLETAVGDVFSTTFDGTRRQADVISKRAWTECCRILQEHRKDLGFFARLRARRYARAEIAREKRQLLEE